MTEPDCVVLCDGVSVAEGVPDPEGVNVGEGGISHVAPVYLKIDMVR